jgi:lipopolysaccharide/colanic/teichoic acid biosynthesis glycosyltransferase
MLKRIFDFVLALVASFFLSWIIVLIWFLCCIDTRTNGLFTQIRVGRYGKLFKIYKLRTMHVSDGSISRFGAFLRKFKIDEIPQLWNVIIGSMSIVGPRPDVPGYYDLLEGEDKKVLRLKPGITSLASLKYVNEESILQQQIDAKSYNDEVIFRDKVKMNLEYYKKRNFLFEDLIIICKTIGAIAKTFNKK